MKRVVGYARVSTEEQKKEGYSLQDQRRRIESYIESNGYLLEKLYEEDHSAKDFNRPVFKEFMEDLKSGEVRPDVFLVVKVDRFTRSVEHTQGILREFYKRGIELKTVDQQIDMEDPSGVFMFNIMQSWAQFDNENRASNTKRGMRSASKEGRWMGSPPKGYSYSRMEKRSFLIPNQEAAFVKEAFLKFSSGMFSAEALRRSLCKSHDVVCSKQQFLNILRNVAYIGKIKLEAWKEEPEQIIEGLHDPLIDEITFNKVQAILSRNNRPKASKTKNPNLPLRGGYLKCPNGCKGHLTGYKGNGNGKGDYYYYRCQSCKKHFKADTLHRELLALLEKIKLPPFILELYRASILETFQAEEKERKQNLNKVKSDLANMERKRSILDDRFIEEKLPIETYNRMLERINLGIESLKERKGALESPHAQYQYYADQGLGILENLKKTYEEGDIEVKQRIVGSIFPNKLVFEGEKYRTIGWNSAIELLISLETGFPQGNKKTSPKNTDWSKKAPPLGLEPRTY